MEALSTKTVSDIEQDISIRHRIMPERLKHLRKRCGMDPAKIKDLTGFSQAYLSQIEHGKQSPSIKTLLKLHGIYGASIDYMVARTNKKEPYEKGSGKEHFADVRKSHKLTQFDLANLLRYRSATPVQKQEKKGISMTLERLEILADYFKVPLDYLLGLTDTDVM